MQHGMAPTMGTIRGEVVQRRKGGKHRSADWPACPTLPLAPKRSTSGCGGVVWQHGGVVMQHIVTPPQAPSEPPMAWHS